MDYDKIIEFAPVIVVVFLVFLQNRLFVTPEQLERRHRDILREIENRFATVFSVSELKEQFSEIKVKIDKIYEVFMKGK